ncbi:hypothetical protein IL992_38780 [Microbispora sp. NEAU-D428]|uniref:hypothetical protein n=1 Tax=Microbispora sitophila TaxID=2771537 RepID=UPI0018685F64|nr:hypothetical protein [Microbispora sitophila]MBE3015071.1 hypothetical protein [Microbispora sitophila]
MHTLRVILTLFVLYALTLGPTLDAAMQRVEAHPKDLAPPYLLKRPYRLVSDQGPHLTTGSGSPVGP